MIEFHLSLLRFLFLCVFHPFIGISELKPFSALRVSSGMFWNKLDESVLRSILVLDVMV